MSPRLALVRPPASAPRVALSMEPDTERTGVFLAAWIKAALARKAQRDRKDPEDQAAA